MYQSIARKYRPPNFKSIVGQDSIVTTLKNAIKLGKIASGYIFSGSRGTGKTTIARVLAKALNCVNLSKESEPCNVCTNCLEISSGRCLDVLEIDGASNRGIDDIRQINDTVGYSTSSCKYKIFIIDEVHMLTKEAFNALLKTLEEPPENVKFFFATTEPHKVLPTILSRCQRFELKRISPEQIFSKLREIANDMSVKVNEDALHLIAHLAEGGLRDAESLLDQLTCYSEDVITYEMIAKTMGLTSNADYFRLDEAIKNHDISFAFTLAEEIFSSGKDFLNFLEGLMEHFRTISVLKLNLSPPSFLPSKDLILYRQVKEYYTQEQCLHILDKIMQWYKDTARTPFKRISLEMILASLIQSSSRLSVGALVKRLIELEQKIASSSNKTQNSATDSPSIPHSIERPVMQREPQVDPVISPVAPEKLGVENHLKAVPHPLHSSTQELSLKEESSPITQESSNQESPPLVKEEMDLKVKESAPLPALSTNSFEDSEEKLDSFKQEEPKGEALHRETGDLKPVEENKKTAPSPVPVEELVNINFLEPEAPKAALKKPEIAPFEQIKAKVPPASQPLTEQKESLQTSNSDKIEPKTLTVKYDTIMRFTAIELEGTLKKD